MKNALLSPHLSLHVRHDQRVTVVLQTRNTDGTFRSPSTGLPLYPGTQHIAIYRPGQDVDTLRTRLL